MLLTATNEYTRIKHHDGTVFAGGLEGVASVVESSGEPFGKGIHFYRTCVVFGKQTSGALELVTECTGTDVNNDKAHLYLSGSRGKGDMSEGGGGELEIMGGTGRFAKVKGSCPYDAAYLTGNRNVTTANCNWSQ